MMFEFSQFNLHTGLLTLLLRQRRHCFNFSVRGNSFTLTFEMLNDQLIISHVFVLDILLLVRVRLSARRESFSTGNLKVLLFPSLLFASSSNLSFAHCCSWISHCVILPLIHSRSPFPPLALCPMSYTGTPHMKHTR